MECGAEEEARRLFFRGELNNRNRLQVD